MTIVLPNLEQIFVYTFFVALGIQLFYYLFFYLRIALYKNKSISSQLPPVSVIICAKNAGTFLQKFLPSILEQDYPEFEVIVVNDCSSDDTETELAILKNKYKHLKTTSLFEEKKFKHGKKLALTVGIKAAQYETLVLTDADCYAVSDQWLRNMVTGFSETKTIVLGYGPYESQDTFLNKIIRYDSLFIAMNYLSFAMAGIPYMGVGRNLAYRKKVFWDNKGFESHYYLTSGDDDLFINEVANSKNTYVELNKNSFMYSLPKTTFKEWFYQKRRHSVTGKLYKKKHKFLLGLEPLSRVIFYLFFILYFIFGLEFHFIYVLGGFFLRLAIQLLVVKLSMIRLNEKKLLLYSLVIDLLIPLLYFRLFFTKKNSYYYNKKWN